MPRASVRPRKGFTLLELMAITMIIGILATLAITKMAQTKRRAFLSAMQADLRNLATVAESHFVVRNSYEGFQPPAGSSGVTLTFTLKGAGYLATAAHEGIPDLTCTIDTSGDGATTPECK